MLYVSDFVVTTVAVRAPVNYRLDYSADTVALHFFKELMVLNVRAQRGKKVYIITKVIHIEW